MIDDALERMETIVESTLTLARHGNVVGETEPLAVDGLAKRCWNRIDALDARLGSTIGFAPTATVIASSTSSRTSFPTPSSTVVGTTQRTTRRLLRFGSAGPTRRWGSTSKTTDAAFPS